MDIRVVFHKALDPIIGTHRRVLDMWLPELTDENLRQRIVDCDMVQINLRVNGNLHFMFHGFLDDEPVGLVMDEHFLIDLEDICDNDPTHCGDIKEWYNLVTHGGVEFNEEFWYAD